MRSRNSEPDGGAEAAADAAVGRTRLHVDEPLDTGVLLALGTERSHYLRHVLRLSPGAALAVFNGRDGEWRAVIDGFTKAGCRLRVEERRLAPPTTMIDGPWLLFAPIKRARLELLVEKATELGAARLLPVVTRYTDIARLNLDRLGAIAVEAAEQCQRLSVPEIAPPQPLARVLADWPAGRPLLACAEAGPVRPIAAAVSALVPGPVGILVGPEGGFSDGELDELARHPLVVAIGLGPRVLRAETAAMAALACWQAWCGDGVAEGGGDVRPPFRG